MKRWILLLPVLVTGCFPVHYHGKTYHAIIGVGVFRVSDTNQVTVVKATSVGVYLGDGRANLGFSSVYAARVPTNAEVILEVTK